MRTLQLLTMALLGSFLPTANADTLIWCNGAGQPTCGLPGSFSERNPTPEDTTGLIEARDATYSAVDYIQLYPEFTSRNGFVRGVITGNMANGDFIYRDGQLICCSDRVYITGINANDIAVGNDLGTILYFDLSGNGPTEPNWAAFGIGIYTQLLQIDDNNNLLGIDEGRGYFELIRDTANPSASNPEPSTFLLLAPVIVGWLLARQRKARRSSTATF